MQLWHKQRKKSHFWCQARYSQTFRSCPGSAGSVREYRLSYTHLQPAQVIRFSYWLMNHCEALRQGYQRLNQMDSVHWCPLGSGAIAGNALGIDRDALASDLGFKNGPSLNAANSTGNRDAVLGEGYTDFSPPYGSKWYMFNFWENMFRYPFFDFLYAMSTIFIFLSKMCEDMIIFSTPQFGFISLHQSYCTGSSLMPQVIFLFRFVFQN